MPFEKTNKNIIIAIFILLPYIEHHQCQEIRETNSKNIHDIELPQNVEIWPIDEQGTFKSRRKKQEEKNVEMFVNIQNISQLELLAEKMKPITPEEFVNDEENTSPKFVLIQHIQKFVRDMKSMVGITSLSSRERGLLEETSNLADSLASRPEVTVSDLKTLIENVKKVMAFEQDYFYSNNKAPYAKLGFDSFEDIDHKDIAMAVKKCAKLMVEYLKTRAQAGDHDCCSVMHKNDEIVAQAILVLAKLHRATMRNWYNILMITSNFANFMTP